MLNKPVVPTLASALPTTELPASSLHRCSRGRSCLGASKLAQQLRAGGGCYLVRPKIQLGGAVESL